MIDQYPFCESFQVLKNLGFDGVEICLEKRNWELRQELFQNEYLDACKEALSVLSLSPFSVSYHCDYIYKDTAFEYMKKLIPAARHLGAEIVVFSGTKKQSADADEWMLMKSKTKELVGIAEHNGIILANEPEPNFIVGTTQELLRLFDEIPSDNLACNLDLGHVFLCDPDPMKAIQLLGSKVVHAHVENMQTGVHRHLLPQQGDMDLKAYFEALNRIEFKGGMALDIYDYDYQKEAPEAIAYLRSLLPK
jgi:sugar phosphate isomerase/epimerase